MDSFTQLPELQPPESRSQIERTFAGYQMWLARASPDQLRTELARINGLLETQSRTALTEVIARGTSG
ncbi:MAG TPA: hypothetical protein VIU37_08700, partial [Candidatus Limnocylindrales bacterium]